MNASKTLTALAAAAALVGTIGYASAQQGSDTMAPNAGSPADPGTLQQQPAQSTTPSVNDSTAPSAVPSDTTSSTVDTERAPQADRN